MSLSFKTIITLFEPLLRLLTPSKASPFAILASPMKATISYFSLFKSLATAIPLAAEIDVELWPHSKWSYGDSDIFWNPEIPSDFLKRSKERPVRILYV